MKSLFKFLLLLVLSAGLLLPVNAVAADKFMAVIITGDLPRYKSAHEAFLKILQKGGMTEDKVEIFVQRPNPDPMSWTNSVRKAVGVGADLIVTYGAPATVIAKKYADGIPVLFADVGDPVALGIVKGLATPGGDITGVSSQTPIETLLKNFVASYQAKSLGVIYSDQDKEASFQVKVLQKISGKYGFKVVPKKVRSCKEVVTSFDSIVGQIDSLYVPHCAVLEPAINKLVESAVAANIPTITQGPDMAAKGALMEFSAEPVEQGQLLGVHALQVLNGQKAFTLPVRTPKKVNFLINLKTAKKMGIKIPLNVIETASKVIK
ncbi:MAG: hypothetical protein C0623_04945 [Desulfuromonas sp.]|nr:MAG: hypothetical protein C0623_04945 [Desulfuromonas sp.]